HGTVYVGDTPAAGEQQALSRYVAHGCAAAPDIVHYSHANIDLVHAQRFRREHRFNWIWQMVVQTGLDLAHFPAEAEDNAQLIWLDPEKPGKSPKRDYTKEDESETASAEIAAGQHVPHFVLAPAGD